MADKIFFNFFFFSSIKATSPTTYFFTLFQVCAYFGVGSVVMSVGRVKEGTIKFILHETLDSKSKIKIAISISTGDWMLILVRVLLRKRRRCWTRLRLQSADWMVCLISQISFFIFLKQTPISSQLVLALQKCCSSLSFLLTIS